MSEGVCTGMWIDVLWGVIVVDNLIGEFYV